MTILYIYIYSFIIYFS